MSRSNIKKELDELERSINDYNKNEHRNSIYRQYLNSTPKRVLDRNKNRLNHDLTFHDLLEKLKNSK